MACPHGRRPFRGKGNGYNPHACAAAEDVAHAQGKDGPMNTYHLAALTFGAACLTLFMPISRGQDDPIASCHPLLMTFECQQFEQRLETAENRQASEAIQAEYRRLVAEREQLCPCTVQEDGHAAQTGGRHRPLPLCSR
jgi:hypothetical protein